MGGDDVISGTVLSGSFQAVGESAVVDRELQEGDVLGTYQLERLLGEGSMGQVFQARHVRLGRQVALKVLRSAFGHDSGFVHRFFQEARAVNQINHEHIVEIFDFVEDAKNGRVYCVMELLRGQSLSALLKEETLSVARMRRILVQVCAALGAAHQLGVVHRDVKPDNLFVTHKGGQADFVKVLDFGVAKVLTPEGTSGTLDGTLIGTPTYMSPEQAAGLPVDHRADIYAVGTVLYEMLSGHPPFVASNFGQLMVKILTEAPPALPSHTPAGEPMPQALARLALRCMAKEPEERPQQLSEVITALLVDTAPERVLPENERPTVPMPVPAGLSGSRRPWLAIALSVLGVLGAGFALWRGMERGASTAVAEQSVAEARAPASITLTVNSLPKGARVVRADTGEVLGVTPLVTRQPRADAPMGLRVELAGYAPSEHEVRLDSPATLEVPLVPVESRPQRGEGRSPSRTHVPRKKNSGVRDDVIDPFAH
ncbi:serine/threonine protein kinase [Archangium violaceum]|uniref:serine/threonine-protein kinase n=1 Tax=Archangium violaceum TaxID=83451 RepID=UPI00193B4F9C|nr:serine/threonine-protein kinase [Archangium violaceum]QRK12482.1 serine/threonine protein kinase [Archangium violaceum]